METLIYLGKFILATAFLLLLYCTILRHKANYRFCRAYLVSVPLLGALMSSLSFDLNVNLPFSLNERFEQMEESILTLDNETAPEPMTWSEDAASAPVTSANVAVGSESQPVSIATLNDTNPASFTSATPATSEAVTFTEWIERVIAGISCLLLLIFAYHVWRVIRIKRPMHKEKTSEGYEIIYSHSIETPFSFGKTIFLPKGLDAQSQELIVRHEKAHIAHRHYLEVWYMEMVTRLCWFNPLMWFCRTELRNIHEYEADQDVIQHGTDIHLYQSTLLEMVLNENCPVVNGFNHSFIRQRFIEMKNSSAGTLGRVGYASLLVGVAALFASFTLHSTSPATQQEWAMPTWNEPQICSIDGSLSKSLTDTLFLLYLADDYFHFEEGTPTAVIPVVDHKFHYEIPLTKITGGRLRGFGPDGKPTQICTEQFLVPGERLIVQIYDSKPNESPTAFWDFRDIGIRGHVSAVKRAMRAIRNSPNMASPHYPKIDGKRWQQVDIEYESKRCPTLQSVQFGKDWTCLQEDAFSFLYIHAGIRVIENTEKNLFLEDVDGNTYKYLGKFPENTDKYQMNLETAIYGIRYFFEKMPKGTKRFHLCQYTGKTSEANGNDEAQEITAYDKEGRPYIRLAGNVTEKPARNTQKEEPNFHITVTAAANMPDCRYLFELERGHTLKESVLEADMPIDENRQCSFSTHLDDITMAHVTAILPNGSVCAKSYEIPFVPGEEIELCTFNTCAWIIDEDGNRYDPSQFADYRIVGGKGSFYQEWRNAKEFYHATKEKDIKHKEFKKLMVNFLKQHCGELGTLYYFKNEFYHDIFVELDSLPASVLNTKFGKEWLADAPTREHHKAINDRYSKLPLYIFMLPEKKNTFRSTYEPDSLYLMYIREGAYVLDKEYKGDEEEVRHYNAENGVKVYRPIPEKIKAVEKEYYNRLQNKK